MPRPVTLPPGTLRFFARVDRFTCECPRCGQIIQAQFDRAISQVRRKLVQQRREKKAHHTKRLIYNPLTSRLKCPNCRRMFGVGLLLYPVYPRSNERQPDDTKPTYRQLLALRQLAGGFLMTKPIRALDTVNLAVQATCHCHGEHIQPSCPIHGWEELIGPDPPSLVGEAEVDEGFEDD